jgi:hypothetical protein
MIQWRHVFSAILAALAVVSVVMAAATLTDAWHLTPLGGALLGTGIGWGMGVLWKTFHLRFVA